MTDDATVPASVVVDINDAVGTSRETGLHELVVFAKIGGVKVAAQYVGSQILPSDWEPECVHAVGRDEMGHLTGSVGSETASWAIGGF